MGPWRQTSAWHLACPTLGLEESVELWFGNGQPQQGNGEFTGRLPVPGKDSKLI